ncbi:MAG: alpha/beta fold hydrolase [Rhodospirillaceae bacterium]
MHSHGTTNPMSAPAPDLEARFLEPAGFRWGQVVTADGAALRWGHLAAGTAKDCFLAGGFLEFIEKYFEVVRDFRARGFNVWCLDWRGQGRSHRTAGTRPSARAFERDADDLAHFIDTHSPKGHRRLLVGHSMGGAISLLTLHGRPGLVDAAILSAPMLALNTGNVPRWAARALARTMTALGRGGGFVPGAGAWPNLAPRFPKDVNRVSNDPARGKLLDAWFTACEDLRVDGPTYAWLATALALTARVCGASFLKAIRTPILLGSAGHDLLVDPAAHVRAAALLPNCRLVSFEDAKHELFHETDAVRTRWFAAIDAFIREHLGPAGP